jgi:DNA-binding response OmpR family regulator
MIRILIVADGKEPLAAFAKFLEDMEGLELDRAVSAGHGFDLLGRQDFSLVVVDEDLGDMSGLDFARKLVAQNPMTNCTVVSGLSPEAFHEASEGLGLLVQLTPSPNEAQAQKLVDQLQKIMGLVS